MGGRSSLRGLCLALVVGGAGVAGAAGEPNAAPAPAASAQKPKPQPKKTAASAKAEKKPDAKATAPAPLEQKSAQTEGGYHPPDKPFNWDIPKVLTEVEVPAVMETNGIPNRMHVVVVGLPLAEAYSHFLKHFTESGLWVAPPHEQMKLGDGQVMLTGFHPGLEISYSVILAPQSPTRTTVIMGEAFWKDRTFAPSHAFAPVYANAEALLTQDLEGGRSLQYMVRATLGEVETFYSGALSQQGWKKEGGLWVRGSESMQLSITNSIARAGFVDVALVQVNTPLPEDDPKSLEIAPTAGTAGP